VAYLENEHKLLRCPEYWITVPVCPNLGSCSVIVLMTKTSEEIGGRLDIFNPLLISLLLISNLSFHRYHRLELLEVAARLINLVYV
jgi:hypothetical protein